MRKKCFHNSFAIYLYIHTSEKPPHENVQTFKQYFRGFSKLRRFHYQFCEILWVVETQLVFEAAFKRKEEKKLLLAFGKKKCVLRLRCA